MLFDPVGLDDRPVGLKWKITADRAEFRDRSHHLGGIPSKPMTRIDGEAPRLQLAEEILHPLRERGGGLHRPVAIEHRREFALSDDVGIELFERSCGGVAGIGKGGEALLIPLGIDPGKGFLGQVDFAADFQHVGGVAVQLRGNHIDRAYVAGHLVAGGSITPGGGAHQATLFVK